MCHAHQIVKGKGIPPENIITMIYDDVQSSSMNPHKGRLFNWPDGDDVREGCDIDYAGEDVTKDNFLAVLKGDESVTGGKKVLKSTSSDKVFIYYNDHGNAGLIAMPDKTVYADELHDALKTMREKGMYDELLWYTSACYSGSLWKDLLPEDIGVFATTSANHQQSSYGRWCGPPDDVIEGVSLSACLSDEYSSNWMKDTKESEDSRTIIDQYNHVVSKVTKSNPQRFGQESVGKRSVHAFIGAEKKSTAKEDSFKKLFTATKELEDHSELVK